MKTIGIILSASTLALLAIASLAGPAQRGLAPRMGNLRRVNARPSAHRLPGWQQPIAGSRSILEARFVPSTNVVVAPLVETAAPADDALRGAVDEASDADTAALPAMTVHWTLPLVSRFITNSRRLEAMSPDLQDAINRIEPMYDPTRLDGLYTDSVSLRVWAGTASMSDVFGEHWHLASEDPNVNMKVQKIGLAWIKTGAVPCEGFTKNRPHDFGEPTLTNLDEWDCRRVERRQAARFNDAAPVPLVVAPLSVPVFAAPMPGSRLSSQDFWAQQRARINIIQARIRAKWQAATPIQAVNAPLRMTSAVKVSSSR